jgi:transposase
MVFAAAAVERAMKMQEVIVRALSGALTWLQAADILGMDPRSLRRWGARFEAGGQLALCDRRRRRPSWRKAPALEVQRILRLYREQYLGFNVRHFHHLARRDHGVTVSYSFVRLALQEAGLVPKRRPAAGTAGAASAARVSASSCTSTSASMRGWPSAQTNGRRSSPCSTTPPNACSTRNSGPRRRPTPSWPPWPTCSGASACRSRCTPTAPAGPSTRRRRAAASTAVIRPSSAAPCVASGSSTSAPARPRRAAARADLDQLLCEEEERVVEQDNIVTFDGVALQLAKQPDRPTCARLHVTVRRHLDGTHTVWRGPGCLGRFDSAGHPLARVAQPRRRDHSRTTETIPVVVPRLRRRPRPPAASPTAIARPRCRPRLPVAASV